MNPLLLIAALLAIPLAAQADGPKTERQYLSGTGPDDAVSWEFRCTGGRRANETTTIPVPSNWEQQGFGSYNYGQEPVKSDEHGLYRMNFAVPEAWAGRRIRLVFNGVMTDATVKVNGQSAGPTHTGGFYQFRYDITSLVKPGKEANNVLEVDVAKVSSHPATERAERNSDYWVFGGIFRPVWIEAVPERWIDHVAIDARADGTLTADLTLGNTREEKRSDNATAVSERIEAQVLGANGEAIGAPFTETIPGGGIARLRVSTRIAAPRLWTAETPQLYTLRLSRFSGDKVVHSVTRRFGFRTFEVRDGQGLFLNGQRILLKGVNRHSFRPETGRTLTRENCYEDAHLIKSMNMNAVRMSHYPPDEAFLEACDELGLYVLDELSGWQASHNLEDGRLLVREMVERDVNHPSILLWDNGNEGGWNRDLDGEFAIYDPQHRRVIHPWELFSGIDTKHYPSYEDLMKRIPGPNLVMPTEFLHGLYDGGAGAGLADYWKAISQSPFGAGGFIWVFADEGIARTDKGGKIDVFSTRAPDGIVGPHHEKEGSYETVRDVWSPVQITPPVMDAKFTGKLAVTNNYDFITLDQCRFQWKLLKYPGPSDEGKSPQIAGEGVIAAPTIAPHATGQLSLPLPNTWSEADALSLVAFGPDERELWTWTWPTPGLAKRIAVAPQGATDTPQVKKEAGGISLTSGNFTASFDAATGFLQGVHRGDRSFALANGPKLTFARPLSAGPVEWLPFASQDAASHTYQLAQPHSANAIEVDLAFDKKIPYANFKLEISPDGKSWELLSDSSRSTADGKSYNFPPQPVLAVRLSDVRRFDDQPIEVKSVRLGYAAGRFPAETTAATVTSGIENDATTGKPVAWVESRGAAGLDRFRWTLAGDGSLRLDYSYTLEGDFLFHGITFDHPENQTKSLRWLGQGPYRVYQNRLRGTWLGVHEIARNDIQPGSSFGYPEFQGYFAGLRWARLATTAGPITVRSDSPEIFLRNGTPKISHPNTSVEFPAGDLSFLHAIPAMGSKFSTPEKTGPEGQPAKASGSYRSSLTFSFDEATATPSTPEAGGLFD